MRWKKKSKVSSIPREPVETCPEILVARVTIRLGGWGHAWPSIVWGHLIRFRFLVELPWCIRGHRDSPYLLGHSSPTVCSASEHINQSTLACGHQRRLLSLFIEALTRVHFFCDSSVWPLNNRLKCVLTGHRQSSLGVQTSLRADTDAKSLPGI